MIKITLSSGHLLVGKIIFLAFFVFQDTQLKFSVSVWFKISWNLTRFQLIQTTLNKLNTLKVCEVSLNSKLNICWKFQLSILRNKKLFLKKYELRVRIVLFPTNRWCVFMSQFWNKRFWGERRWKNAKGIKKKVNKNTRFHSLESLVQVQQG